MIAFFFMVLIRVLAGKFLALPALVFITIAEAVLVLYFWGSEVERKRFGVIATLLRQVVMWGTYFYLTSNSVWIGKFLHAHILR